MHPRPNTALRASTVLLLVHGLLVLGAPRASAQSTDSTHWSLFAGSTTSPAEGADRSFGFPAENFGVGGSVEFTSSLFPARLRATLSYDKFRGGATTTLKATSLMVGAVFRPLPSAWGIRPYLLAGLGIATVSPSGMQVLDGGVPRVISIARTTALEMHPGVGLEYRRLFMEYTHSPYGLIGDRMPSRTPIRVGFRF